MQSVTVVIADRSEAKSRQGPQEAARGPMPRGRSEEPAAANNAPGAFGGPVERSQAQGRAPEKSDTPTASMAGVVEAVEPRR